MKNVVVLLTELINDPSFVSWLRGTGTAIDSERWEKWLNDEFYNKQIVAKAKKLQSIPFTEVDVDYNAILGELEKLKDQLGILRLKKTSQQKTNDNRKFAQKYFCKMKMK